MKAQLNTSNTLFSKKNIGLLYKRKSEVVIVFLLLFAMIIVTSLISENFLAARNIRNLIISNIGLLFITFAQLIVISLGGIDLSVGAVISMVNVTAVSLITEDPTTWAPVCLLCAAMGAGIGAANGLLVVKGNMQPIIATLATQTIFMGVALLIMKAPSGTLPSELCKFVSKGWSYIFPILLMAIVTILMWLIMNRTNFGRAIYAVGGNEQAAECSGISITKTKMLAFAAAGFMAAIAGLYITFYSTSGNPLIGDVYTQRSITTAVVGGAVLAGGKSSVIGCLAAVGIMGIINNMLNLMGVYSYYQFVIQGVILVAALAISAIRAKK